MSSRLSWYVCRLWPYWLISAWSHQFCDGAWTACQRVERHEITTWQKSDFCICGTNREIKTSKTEVNTSTCSFSSKYKNIDLQSYELYETSKNSPLKCCMSDILAKNKLQIKYKKIGMLRSDIWMGGTSNANSKSWTERPCWSI